MSKEQDKPRDDEFEDFEDFEIVGESERGQESVPAPGMDALDEVDAPLSPPDDDDDGLLDLIGADDDGYVDPAAELAAAYERIGRDLYEDEAEADAEGRRADESDEQAVAESGDTARAGLDRFFEDDSLDEADAGEPSLGDVLSAPTEPKPDDSLEAEAFDLGGEGFVDLDDGDVSGTIFESGAFPPVGDLPSTPSSETTSDELDAVVDDSAADAADVGALDAFVLADEDEPVDPGEVTASEAARAGDEAEAQSESSIFSRIPEPLGDAGVEAEAFDLGGEGFLDLDDGDVSGTIFESGAFPPIGDLPTTPSSETTSDDLDAVVDDSAAEVADVGALDAFVLADEDEPVDPGEVTASEAARAGDEAEAQSESSIFSPMPEPLGDAGVEAEAFDFGGEGFVDLDDGDVSGTIFESGAFPPIGDLPPTPSSETTSDDLDAVVDDSAAEAADVGALDAFVLADEDEPVDPAEVTASEAARAGDEAEAQSESSIFSPIPEPLGDGGVEAEAFDFGGEGFVDLDDGDVSGTIFESGAFPPIGDLPPTPSSEASSDELDAVVDDSALRETEIDDVFDASAADALTEEVEQIEGAATENALVDDVDESESSIFSPMPEPLGDAGVEAEAFDLGGEGFVDLDDGDVSGTIFESGAFPPIDDLPVTPSIEASPEALSAEAAAELDVDHDAIRKSAVTPWSDGFVDLDDGEVSATIFETGAFPPVGEGFVDLDEAEVASTIFDTGDFPAVEDTTPAPTEEEVEADYSLDPERAADLAVAAIARGEIDASFLDFDDDEEAQAAAVSQSDSDTQPVTPSNAWRVSPLSTETVGHDDQPESDASAFDEDEAGDIATDLDDSAGDGDESAEPTLAEEFADAPELAEGSSYDAAPVAEGDEFEGWLEEIAQQEQEFSADHNAPDDDEEEQEVDLDVIDVQLAELVENDSDIVEPRDPPFRIVLLETLLLFGLIAGVELFFGDGGLGSYGTHPHPYWLVVLPMAAARGLVAALTAATIASALYGYAAMEAVHASSVFEILDAVKLQECLLFFAAGFVIGEFRDSRQRRQRDLWLALQETRREWLLLGHEKDLLSEANKVLKRRLVDHTAQFGNLMRTATRLESASQNELYEVATEMVVDHCGVDRCSVLVRIEGSLLDIGAQVGWPQDELQRLLLEASESALIAQALHKGQRMNGFEPGQTTPRKGPLVVAPIVDTTGVVIALLCLDEIPIRQLNDTTIMTFYAIAEWIGATMRRAHRGSSEWDNKFGLRQAVSLAPWLGCPGQLGERIRVEDARCSRQGVMTSLIAMRAPLTSIDDELLRELDRTVIHTIGQDLRPMDGLYRFGYPGCFVAVLTGAAAEDAVGVASRLTDKWHEGEERPVDCFEIVPFAPDIESPDLMSLLERIADFFRLRSSIPFEGEIPVEVPEKPQLGTIGDFARRIMSEWSIAVRFDTELYVLDVRDTRRDLKFAEALARHMDKVGDQVLRATDGVYRTSESQFAVVLPGATCESSFALLARMIEVLEERIGKDLVAQLETNVYAIGHEFEEYKKYLGILLDPDAEGGVE